MSDLLSRSIWMNIGSPGESKEQRPSTPAWPVDANVVCIDGERDQSTAAIIDDITGRVTHFVIELTGRPLLTARRVPLAFMLDASHRLIRLKCTGDELAAMEPFVSQDYNQVKEA